jgi:hypothetical protein
VRGVCRVVRRGTVRNLKREKRRMMVSATRRRKSGRTSVFSLAFGAEGVRVHGKVRQL